MVSLQEASSKEDVCCSENRQQKTPEPSSTQAVICPLPYKGSELWRSVERRTRHLNYFMQGYKPGCLLRYIGPCPCATAHKICKCRLLAFAPFFFSPTTSPLHTQSILCRSHEDITKLPKDISLLSQHRSSSEKSGGTLGIRSVVAMFYMVS